MVDGDPGRGDVAVPDGGQGADDDDANEEEAVALVVKANCLSDARRTVAQGRAGRRLAGEDRACDGEEDDVGENYEEVVEGRQGEVDGGQERAQVGDDKGCPEGEEGEIGYEPVHGEESFEAVRGKVAPACQQKAARQEFQRGCTACPSHRSLPDVDEAGDGDLECCTVFSGTVRTPLEPWIFQARAKRIHIT